MFEKAFQYEIAVIGPEDRTLLIALFIVDLLLLFKAIHELMSY
jgi:hypothetical protein